LGFREFPEGFCSLPIGLNLGILDQTYEVLLVADHKPGYQLRNVCPFFWFSSYSFKVQGIFYCVFVEFIDISYDWIFRQLLLNDFFP
jgi:hypothetical protein